MRKLFKQSWFFVSKSLSTIESTLPEGYNIMKENLSWIDYVTYHVSRFFSRFFLVSKKFTPHYERFSMKHSSWYILIVWIVMILLVSIGIISLTRPYASVVITPQSSIWKSMRNITFYPEDEAGEENGVAVRRNILDYEFSKMYTVNNYDPLSLQRARGVIKIKNFGSEVLKLKPQTRFIHNNIVFRIEEWIELWWTLDSEPAEGSFSVIADGVDSNGNLIGESGNIPDGTILTIPGLPADIQEKIKVFAVWEFTGGSNVAKKIFTKAEKSRIEAMFRSEFYDFSWNSLKNTVKNKDEYIPLQIAEALETIQIDIDYDAEIWDKVEEVTLIGRGQFMSHLYNIDDLRKILIDAAKNQLLEDTETLLDMPQAIPDIVSVIETSDSPWRIKVTAEIPLKILYDFSSESGQRNLQNKLLKLLNTEKDIVRKTLLNDFYIHDVDIRVTPFWIQSLPSSIDNIYIKILKPKL